VNWNAPRYDWFRYVSLHVAAAVTIWAPLLTTITCHSRRCRVSVCGLSVCSHWLPTRLSDRSVYDCRWPGNDEHDHVTPSPVADRLSATACKKLLVASQCTVSNCRHGLSQSFRDFWRSWTQSCDLDTKFSGLKDTRVQFLKVLVLVSEQRSWLKTEIKFKSRLCTAWHLQCSVRLCTAVK